MSKRRIRRDLHKRVASAGYQQIAGDLEVRGRILGPTVTNLASGVGALSAITTTPVQLAAPTAQGTMRSIALNWSRQYTLSNLSHYELQVSDNDQDWYSLDLDGGGWGIELNGDTDVKAEYFTHPNIPLVQDGSDLVGKKLYYRVRQVTLAGVKGPWSESCNATTKPVNDLVLTDSYNRYIEISSHKGIYADDRQGHIIHDIPNAPILTGMNYGGHIVFADAPNYVGSIILTYTDTETARGLVSATTNTSLAVASRGLTNIHGAIVAVSFTNIVAAAKVVVGTYTYARAKYSVTYNSAPGLYNFMVENAAEAVVAGVRLIIYETTSSILVPVFWNENIPYVTWNIQGVFGGMGAGNATYSCTAYLYLLGFLV